MTHITRSAFVYYNLNKLADEHDWPDQWLKKAITELGPAVKKVGTSHYVAGLDLWEWIRGL